MSNVDLSQANFKGDKMHLPIPKASPGTSTAFI